MSARFDTVPAGKHVRAADWSPLAGAGMLTGAMSAPSTSEHYRRIERALQRLLDSPQLPSLDQLAAEAGLSAFHFQRLFLAHAGLSPKEFWQARALHRASASLLREASVLDAALAAGLSGPSRLHDLMVGLTALTPGEYKGSGAGLSIRCAEFDSIVGRLWLACTDRGVMRLEFIDGPGRGETLEAKLRVQWPAAAIERDAITLRPIIDEISRRLAGAGAGRSLGLALAGSGFRVQVWQALLRLPEGALCSYSQLAQLAGQPRAVRAVASAVANNPIALLIPCHRVIRANAEIGEYRWGRERKQLLLGLEAGRRAQG